MAVQRSSALVGLSKQTAKGSPMATVTFAHGIAGGQVLSADISQEADEVTAGTRVQPFVIRKSAIPGVGWDGRVYPKSIGLLLYGALGGISTSGAGPYTHTITPGSSLPYLSAFGKFGGNWYLTQDAKIDECEISWEGGGVVETKCSAIGTLVTYPAAPTITNDETTVTPFLAGGGTFKFDVDSATAVTAPVSGGTLTIKNNVEPVLLSASVAPDDTMEGLVEIEMSLKLIPTDLADWRTIFTGTSSGTTVSQVPIYGSFEVTFTQGAASVKLAALAVAYTVDFPEADPKGGPVELELKGVCTGSTPLTATVINTQATY